MKYMNIIGAIVLFVMILSSCTQQSDFPVLRGPYLGQQPPGMTPEIFAPGIISTRNQEIHLASSPDGKEIYYTATDSAYQNPFTIYYTEEINGKWTSPELAPFVRYGYNSVSAFSPDGNRLFFNACAMPNIDETEETTDIWYVDRRKGGWADPVHMDSIVNSKWNDAYPSVSSNGNLYFTSNREGGLGSYDVYFSEYKNGTYLAPKNLGSAINTVGNERHACIAPDESYILFDSRGPDTEMGLYVGFRKKDGTWTQAKYIGEDVNKYAVIFHVNISSDGKYIFTSGNPVMEITANRDIYWFDAKVIEEIKPDHCE